MQFARVADAENGPVVREGKAQLPAGKGGLNPTGNRRALGDIGNLVGGFNQKVNVGKDAAQVDGKASNQSRTGVLTRRAAAQLAAANGTSQNSGSNSSGDEHADAESWEAEAADAVVLPARAAADPAPAPAAAAPAPAAAAPVAAAPSAKGRSLSQLLAARSSAAAAGGRMHASARPASRAKAALPDIDAAGAGDPLTVAEYAADIFRYYRRVEPTHSPCTDYMGRQGDVNERMRAILVDWLVDVHLKFKLMPETLYLTLSLIDRFLATKQVTRRHLQLVGVTAMLIAAKYEEIWAPEVRDFVYISDRAYSRDQILQMEKIMLNALRFNLTVPTPHMFLTRFLKASGDADRRETSTLAAYLVELSLPDYGCLRYAGSKLAAAAVLLAREAMGEDDTYPLALERHSGYTPEGLQAAVADLRRIAGRASKASLSAVYKKYSHERFFGVAKNPALNGDVEVSA